MIVWLSVVLSRTVVALADPDLQMRGVGVVIQTLR